MGEVGSTELGADAHIIINEDGGVGNGVGVEDGIVFDLEPGRMNAASSEAPDLTPRACVISLPIAGCTTVRGPVRQHHHRRGATIRARARTDVARRQRNASRPRCGCGAIPG